MDGFQRLSHDKNYDDIGKLNDSTDENEDKELSEPELNEFEKLFSKPDEIADNFDLCTSQNDSRNISPKSQDEILTGNNEQASCMHSSKRKGKHNSYYVDASNTALHGNLRDTSISGSILNTLPNEAHSKINTSFKDAIVNFEPANRTESGLCVPYDRKSSTTEVLHEESNCEMRTSASFQEADNENCEMTFEGRKRQSFTKELECFMDSLKDATKRDSLDSQNISEIWNDIQSSILPRNKELNADIDMESGALLDLKMLSRVTTRIHWGSYDMSSKVNESTDAKKDANAVAGPSGILPQLLRNADSKTFTCDVCYKEFPGECSLDRHYRIHTGEKPFVCDKCKKPFAQKGNLKAHYRKHTGEKPFVCNKCNEGFTSKSNLTRHARVHTREKPFVCNECNEGFADKSKLTRHARVHTGEKPFKCKVCGKAFPHKHSLDRHYKRKNKCKKYNNQEF